MNLIGVPFYSKATRIYQATKDGFGASSFHSKVNGILGTLTVVKSTNGNIFGGFTSLSWGASTAYHYDPSAYIFSLVNQQNYPCKLNQISTYYSSCSKCSMQPNPVLGPNFGGSPDLGIADQSNSNNNSKASIGFSYQAPFNYIWGSPNATSFLAGSLNFQTLEVEVYTIYSIILILYSNLFQF